MLTANDLPRAPEGLSAYASLLWDALVLTKARSLGRLTLLEAALRAWDRANEAASLVTREGLTVTSERSGVIHAHPAVKLEKEFRAQFLSAWGQLGLSYDQLQDSPKAIEAADHPPQRRLEEFEEECEEDEEEDNGDASVG